MNLFVYVCVICILLHVRHTILSDTSSICRQELRQSGKIGLRPWNQNFKRETFYRPLLARIFQDEWNVQVHRHWRNCQFQGRLKKKETEYFLFFFSKMQNKSDQSKIERICKRTISCSWMDFNFQCLNHPPSTTIRGKKEFIHIALNKQ